MGFEDNPADDRYELDLACDEIKRLQAQVESLSKFKAYVHQRLDDAGIPTDPDSPHKAQGCRIGGRLDVLLAERAELLAIARRITLPEYFGDSNP